MEVSVLQAKTDFSKLLHMLESKQEESITVTRYGKPVAKITPCHEPPVVRRIGVLKGLSYKSMTQEEFDKDNEEIAKWLAGDLE